MQPHLEWTEPQAVLEHRKSEVKRVIREFWWFTTKWCWPLWLLASVVVYYFGPKALAPAEFNKFFTYFISLGLLFPTAFVVLMSPVILLKLASKAERYEINSKGILISGYSALNWMTLESYRFDDHPELTGLRILEVKRKPIKGLIVLPGQLSFDPSQTSEQEMRAILEQFRR